MDPQNMQHVPVSYAVVIIGILLGLIGIIYRNLTSEHTDAATKAKECEERLRQNIKEVRSEMKVLEDKTPDKDTCILCSQLAEEKFQNIHGRIEYLKTMSKENHSAIVLTLSQLHRTVDSINSCVAKLSVSAQLAQSEDPTGGLHGKSSI